MTSDEVATQLWRIPFPDRLGILLLSIVEANRDTYRASLGLVNSVEALSAYLTDEQCGRLASTARDVCDRIEHRALAKVSQP